MRHGCVGCAKDITFACNSIPECDLFVYFPRGKSLNATPDFTTSAILKTARDPSNSSNLLCAGMHFHLYVMLGKAIQARAYRCEHVMVSSVCECVCRRTDGGLLDPKGYDGFYSFNALAATYVKRVPACPLSVVPVIVLVVRRVSCTFFVLTSLHRTLETGDLPLWVPRLLRKGAHILDSNSPLTHETLHRGLP